ncbi:MAG TPA: YiiX/YebB-like N1pC/P60 family cysteine hydrolase [bacterium]|nr:YiiX/YebB-like N1pC/P60 family cysteine hydrolase [bacterium]HQG44162.1 YiiX/YebB-like N1pC/P60 family cysteine hydrolase [bacterium]HQI49367.1 YiiX/YebB-like N1pC/P60 family cysteine hydrolase [bacterium]HQJ64872.1 YiiX/YebB-like N1pC/P60 family cysteine hydrolase [bacterium]
MRTPANPAVFLDYASTRADIRDGDILLYESDTFYSRIIKKVTHSRYTHAGIAVWWFERLMVMEAVGSGVGVTPLSVGIKKHKARVHWFTAVRPLTEEQRRQMIMKGQEELGKKYDLWHAIWVGIKLLFNWEPERRDALRKEKKFFCSAYVAHVYNACGIDLKCGLSDSSMVPEDIATSTELTDRGILKNME